MPDTPNILARHQLEIAARLEADEYFADIQVFVERQGDLAGKLDEALKGLRRKNGKVGAAVMVGVVRADVENPDVPGPWFNLTFCDVTAFENVLLNTSATGTGKACVDIAARINRVVHHYLPGGLGGPIVATQEAIRPLGEVRSGVIAYKSRFRLNPDLEQIPRVATPVFDPPSDETPTTITLSCATPGAAIYYTLNESYPWAGNPDAIPYSAPISLSAAARVRATAFLAGRPASDTAVGVFV